METMIVSCPHCRAKNRIPLDKKEATANCGRCHRSFSVSEAQRQGEQILTLRCSQCHVKNRVSVSRLHGGAKCGRCGAALQTETVWTSQPILVNEANFDQTVLQSPLPVLLYGWAPWCGVCGGTSPMVEDLAATTKGKVRVAKLNIDQNPNLASKYNIMSVPAFFIIDAGQIKEYLPGALPKHDLMMKLAHYIS
jgi:thioredoxin 2